MPEAAGGSSRRPGRILAAAARTVPGPKREGDPWRYRQNPLSDCFTCTAGCERSRLGVVCEIGVPSLERSPPGEPCQWIPRRKGVPEVVAFLPSADGVFGAHPGADYGRCDRSGGAWTGCFPSEPPGLGGKPRAWRAVARIPFAEVPRAGEAAALVPTDPDAGRDIEVDVGRRIRGGAWAPDAGAAAPTLAC